jgi:hypothetical protein
MARRNKTHLCLSTHSDGTPTIALLFWAGEITLGVVLDEEYPGLVDDVLDVEPLALVLLALPLVLPPELPLMAE